MFSRKKPEPPKRRNHNLSQFGLTDIPDDFDPSIGVDGGDENDDDSDLEAELAAIAGGMKPRPKPKPKATLVAPIELDNMIAESLRDVESDDGGDDLENDDELLGELQGIAGPVDMQEEPNEAEVVEKPTPEEVQPSGEPELLLPTTVISVVDVIRQRIDMYKIAESNAKASGESAKARRFGRGLKTLNDFLKQANAGKDIKIEDIPPEVSVKPTTGNISDISNVASTVEESTPNVPVRRAPELPTLEKDEAVNEPEKEEPANLVNPIVQDMRVRQQEYKAAALQSKRSGDTAMALQFLKVVKQFDIVIKMCEDGQEVDLSDMPPPPDQFKEFIEKMQMSANQPPDATPISVPETAPVQPPSEVTSAGNMLEALQQRLDKYMSVEEAAKAEGNSSKARRFGRIVKQYEDAIKSYRNGKPVAYDELPVPPGFGPLPLDNSMPVTSQTTTNPTEPNAKSESPSPTTSPTALDKRPSAQRTDLTTRTSGNQTKNNLAEQQMKTLLERQKEYKMAALDAKKAGEIEQAKEYLKIYKGFDALLNAASSGLPVDLNSLPVPPSQRDNLEASFAIVAADDCDPDDDISDIGVRIEEQLAKQLMMCKNTRDHHKAMGDIAGMNRFENLALTVQKDLDLVRYSKRKKFPLPKFHYEKRSFNIVHCNTDLTDNELEIVVVRGLNYNVPNPKDVDTYVKIEFPLLNDESFKIKTALIKDTDSPEYKQNFKVEILRGNRQFQRIFKRQSVKFEVYSRGGFLRSDILIGTVTVKLQPLETKCDIHDTFDLMDGRKAVGGKLEVKVRVRNPILTKQMEHLNEKWLVLDT
ncbi:coiled-coil and C2 domain-containing protein 1-like isoform X2 [Stomoxys calcitrans]|uniref:Coiled-coil and C2 domain-containing protein 1-like n=1 Tax=Stomoxys calcitrans TaxID=35570 RepID=A0A1I8PLZ3_STOCA|nr:coiled-coil and C2 domain-containing protein 1-like isoform X2 [Stomoxys calcitrans]